MAKVTKYLEFTISLTDKALAESLQATYAGGIKMSPAAAATAYSAPIQTTTDPFVAPNVRSPWIAANSDYPTDEASFVRKVGGWFGIHLLFGSTYTYRWIGKFAYAAGVIPEIDGTPTEIVAIAQRRWITSFALPRHDTSGNGGPEYRALGDGMLALTRAASRHVDGRGFACRDSAEVIVQSSTETGGAGTKKIWERWRMRVRKLPNANQHIWRARFSAANSNAIRLNLGSDGRLSILNMDSAGASTTFATAPDALVVGQWTRIDVVYECGNGSGTVKLFFNRKRQLDITITAAGGIGSNANHVTSRMGFDSLPASGEVTEVDFADWVGADHPTEDTVGRWVGVDWLNGSRVRLVHVKGFGAGNAFTGDYRAMNQETPQQAAVGSSVQSSVSGAALVADADEREINDTPGSIGVACFIVIGALEQDVAGNGTIGWRFDGVLDLAAINPAETPSSNWHRRMYRPAGLTAPIQNLVPLELHHVKFASTDPAICYGFHVVMEHLGTFGPEDVPNDTAESASPDAIPTSRGSHNAPYPETPWARARIPPVSAVVVHSGTYVGNGVAQELTFRTNVNWLYVRVAGTAAGEGSFWFSSMNCGHTSGDQGANAGFVPIALVDRTLVISGVENDQEQRVVIRLVGSDSNYNALGTTYEYVAVMDPGARFFLNGAFSHDPDNAGATALVNALDKPSFIPEYTFFHADKDGQGSTSNGRWVKGLGHAAPNGSSLVGGESATIATVSAGQILSGTSLHLSSITPMAYSCWRRDDGSDDPNRFKVVKIGSYVGDGSASRTIGFENATGLRPLLAIVTPHNARSIMRDPSHTGSTSMLLDTGVSTGITGITGGGIDSIAVGSLLNANGIVHDYFVIMGGVNACNNGWSCDGEFIYVEPDWIPEDLDDPDDAEDPDDDIPDDEDPPDVPDDTDDCEAGVLCVTATTREVNRALLEIGNTKFLTDYCTQQTLEARTARILYESSVRSVLHAFPWPFATKYATLALASNQPTNEDWDYAYRQPADCIFERRLVVDRGTGVDPKGPAFELSSDGNGGLIFTNEPNAVLEYTMRPPCVAFVGDALFKEALKWHLAANLAPPLTRMTDKAKSCMDEYDKQIAKANAIIKPGQPGLRDTADPESPDAAAACIAANVNVVNVALVRIGANTIANLATEQSREAVAANLIFEHELRATLRDYPWKFAKRYNEALTLVGGTATVPVNPDWQYSYRLPADYVSVRRLPTTGTGRSFERYPTTFEVGSDDTGALLFTGLEDPNLEYTARIACAVSRADELFRDALAWRLAASLAMSLAQVDPEKEEARGRGPEHPPDPTQRISHKPNLAQMRANTQRWAFGQYLRAIEKARVADANESEPEPSGEAEWIEGRN